MTRDDVIRMAGEAGLFAVPYPHPTNSKEIERFASLVAAAEREACAAICEHGWKTGIGEKHQGDVFATAIRIRGDA